MPHRFVISKNAKGEYVAKFKHNAETIFWTEGYSSEHNARNAIASILKNGPAAEIVEE